MLSALLQQAQQAASQKGRDVVVGYQEFSLTEGGRVVVAEPPMTVVFYVAEGKLKVADGLDPDVVNMLRGGVF